METIQREMAFDRDLEEVFKEQLMQYEYMFDGDDMWLI